MADQDTSIGVLLGQFTRHADRVALTTSDGDLTYPELAAGVYGMARSLAAQGVQRGDVVALATGNRAETFLLRYAANLLGAAVAVLYDGLAAPTLRAMLAAAGATVLVQDATAPPDLGVPSIGIPAPSPDTAPLPVDAKPEDLAAIRFTGGSSGTPKGIPHDARVPKYLRPQWLGGWRDAVQLLCTPMGHLAGTLSDVLFAAGGRVVLHPGFDPGRVLAAIERERVTYLWLQPRLLHQLLDHPALPRTDTSSLKLITLGGAASTPHRVSAAIERFGPIIAQGYGANEIGQITMLTPDEHLHPELLGTVGKPVPSVQLHIRDDTGRPVPTGVTGEIWVRGPGLMRGYHRDPEQTAAAIVDGWLHTGDLGHLDAAGYLTLDGRSKDVILAAGERVYPAHLERLLENDPRVQSAVVFGVTYGDNDEHVCAAVVPAPGPAITSDDVQSLVRNGFGAAHIPETVLMLPALPVLGSGKPDIAALRGTVRTG